MAALGPDQDCEHLSQRRHPIATPDAQCKSCHTLMQGDKVLQSGEAISLHVDLTVLANSVHGLHQVNVEDRNPLLCTDCHVDQERYGFPHEELTATDLRQLRP